MWCSRACLIVSISPVACKLVDLLGVLLDLRVVGRDVVAMCSATPSNSASIFSTAWLSGESRCRAPAFHATAAQQNADDDPDGDAGKHPRCDVGQ